MLAARLLAACVLAVAANACGGGADDARPASSTSPASAASARANTSAAASTSAASQASASASPGPSSSAASSAEPSTDWAKVTRVANAKLKELMPATAAGLARKSLEGSNSGSGAEARSEAVAEYSGPNEVSLKLILQDNPVRAEDNLSEKSGEFQGHAIVGEEESSDEADFAIVVAERFVLMARASNLKLKQLKEVLGKMDLTKLASWKNEGTPR